MEQKKVRREQKMYMLRLKYGQEPNKYFIDNDIFYFYGGTSVSDASNCYLRLQFVNIDNQHLYIEGFNMSFEKDQKLSICVNDEFFTPQKTNINRDVYSLGDVIFYSCSFIFELELSDNEILYNISFYEKIDDHYIQKKEVRYEKYVPFSKTFSKSYFLSENWVGRMEHSSLIIKNVNCVLDSPVKSIPNIQKYEDEFIDEIKKSKLFNNLNLKNAVELRSKIVSIKRIYKLISHKKIWLISDRVNMAGDNGEALFLYLQQINDPNIDVYFVIGDDCDDYERIRQFGKVLVQNSEEYKIMHILADCIISSQINEYVVNPFFREGVTDVFKDIVYSPHYIFLQHGITQNDISDWINKYSKNLSGLVAAAHAEYQAFLDYDYHYTEKEVWLTGFPRYDRLYHDEKKYITIMPTWRKYLSKPSDSNIDVTVLSDDFFSSDYFIFYNRLINDNRLISAATEYGYKICFMPHPNIMNNLNDFDHNPSVIFFGTKKPYREIYAESELVMTDYSSSVIDFAYLRKPIVYCQFDKEKFFAGEHVCSEGYYNYETNGFGEVTYDLDSIVDIMIEYMKNKCEVKPIYKERMEKFFAFNDKNNCERVYKKIKDLS